MFRFIPTKVIAMAATHSIRPSCRSEKPIEGSAQPVQHSNASSIDWRFYSSDQGSEDPGFLELVSAEFSNSLTDTHSAAVI